jgi:hypothetical protein
MPVWSFAALCHSSKGEHSTDDEGRDRAQEFAELSARAGVERVIGGHHLIVAAADPATAL